MLTLKTIPTDTTAPLYHHYPQQTQPQDAYLELDCNNESLDASYNPEIGNAVPMNVWHNQVLRWSVPNTLTASQVNTLLAEVQPLAERIVAGYERVWDGNNHVGRYTEDARSAQDELEAICEDLEGREEIPSDDEPTYTLRVWEEGSPESSCDAPRYDLTHDQALDQAEQVPAGQRWSIREGESLAGELLREGNGE